MIKIIKYLSYGAKFVLDKRVLKKDRAFIAGLVLGESCNLNCEHCNVCHESQENDLSFKISDAIVLISSEVATSFFNNS